MPNEYRVDKKEEIQRLVKGEIQTFFRVWATSKGGTYFHVDISEADLDTTRAEAILTKRAKDLDAI